LTPLRYSCKLPPMKKYRISELAEKAGVSRRTIHYYLARRLIPSPEGSGLATIYTEEHYYRILLIKKWQSSFLPLEEIRRKILPLTLSEVKQALEETGEVIPCPILSHIQILGTVYERVLLEDGLELHVNSKNQKTREQASEIISWWENQKKEG